MRKLILDAPVLNMMLAVAALALASPPDAPYAITEIINATGDRGGNGLDVPYGIAVDSSGNVYVSGGSSDNAFKIATPGTCSTTGTPCTITEIIDAKGDRAGNGLDVAHGIAVDSSGNVYVRGGAATMPSRSRHRARAAPSAPRARSPRPSTRRATGARRRWMLPSESPWSPAATST